MSKKNKKVTAQASIEDTVIAETIENDAPVLLETEVLEADNEVQLSSEQEQSLAETENEDLQAVIEELGGNIQTDANIFLQDEAISEGFLPEVPENIEFSNDQVNEVDLEGTELDAFEAAEIEEVEFVEEERLESIIESILFASDRPVSLASIQLVFKGTNVKKDKIRRALDKLAIEYAGFRRGVSLEEVTGGYQLRTKVDNMEFLRRTVKARPFKLSGPALEVLAIVAYKQPVVKSEIDSIRGVESGHLLRALMEKGLANFEGKSELPGRPMQYGTTRKFLEIFGLRNLKELPTLSQIDELLPEGIGEDEPKEKQTLASITDVLSEKIGISYSEGEDELMKIQGQLEEIKTSSDFFEQEKIRQKLKRDAEKAQNIREAFAMNEEVSTRDLNWLRKYDEALAAGNTANFMSEDDAKANKPIATPSTEILANPSGDESQTIPGALAELEFAEPVLDSEEDSAEDDELAYFGDGEDDDGETDASV